MATGFFPTLNLVQSMCFFFSVVLFILVLSFIDVCVTAWLIHLESNRAGEQQTLSNQIKCAPFVLCVRVHEFPVRFDHTVACCHASVLLEYFYISNWKICIVNLGCVTIWHVQFELKLQTETKSNEQHANIPCLTDRIAFLKWDQLTFPFTIVDI